MLSSPFEVNSLWVFWRNRSYIIFLRFFWICFIHLELNHRWLIKGTEPYISCLSLSLTRLNTINFSFLWNFEWFTKCRSLIFDIFWTNLGQHMDSMHNAENQFEEYYWFEFRSFQIIFAYFYFVSTPGWIIKIISKKWKWLWNMVIW